MYPWKALCSETGPQESRLGTPHSRPLTQGNRIFGHRILGNHENVETVVLRTPLPRIYILAHHYLECCNKGNRILGNLILGNHSLETIVLSTQPPRI